MFVSFNPLMLQSVQSRVKYPFFLNHRYCQLLWPFLLLALPALGQEQDTLRQQDGSFYRYPSQFALRLVYQERELPFTLTPLSGAARAVYQPNSSRTFGIGGNILGISYTFSFQLPQALQRDPDRFGNTEQRDLRVSVYYKRLGLQVDRQEYTGYYLNNVAELDPDWQGDEEFPYRQDLQVRRVGVGLSYLFQSDKFSYSAALNNSKRQHLGGGTFFVQAYGGRLTVGGDSLLLPRWHFAGSGPAAAVEEINVYHGSLMPGYAHTFVMGRFYLMTSLALGPEVQRRNLTDENQADSEQWAVEGRLQLHAAFGYDDDRYFWNVAYLSQRQQYEVDGLGISVNTNGLRFMVGRRFKEFGFMRSIRQWKVYRSLVGGDRKADTEGAVEEIDGQ